MARLTVVIGFMGAGKTTLARELADARGVRHVDTDALLVTRLGKTIPEVFAGDGEAAFRAAEEEVVLGVLDGAEGEDVIVSLGGGSVLAPRVQAALAGHTTVLLDVPLDVAWSRAAGRDRPLARDRDAFAAVAGRGLVLVIEAHPERFEPEAPVFVRRLAHQLGPQPFGPHDELLTARGRHVVVVHDDDASVGQGQTRRKDCRRVVVDGQREQSAHTVVVREPERP